jgi:hypothetical protein
LPQRRFLLQSAWGQRNVSIHLPPAITAMLVVPGAVTPMFIPILIPAIMVVATIAASPLRTKNASGRKNQQCSDGTIFNSSVQRIH